MTQALLTFGGDKLAIQPVDVEPESKQDRARFLQVIENERKAKQAKKAAFEREKEDKLNDTNKVAKVLADKLLRTRKQPTKLNSLQIEARQGAARRALPQLQLTPAQRAIVNEIVILDDEQIIQRNKKILHEFHDNLKTCGWTVAGLCRKLTDEGFETAKQGSDCVVVCVKGTDLRIVLGAILTGDRRYKPSSSGNPHVVEQRGYDKAELVQRGLSEADAELARRRKEYVADKNGVPTRRYVTRAISHFHLANMLGLDYDAASRQWDKVVKQHGPGQYPRGDSTKVGDNVDTFDMRDAAVVENGTHPGHTPHGEVVPGSHSGVPARNATTTFDRDTPLDHNLRTTTQVRNGSGSTQSMLSTTSVQPGPLETSQAKIIRGNKGERFDKSPETVAVVEVDLAQIKAMGIDFVNVHAEDSHQFKSAYKRYISPTDLREKRSARNELDELIYSGRKNREVTLDRIPNGAITRIKAYGKPAKWQGSGLNFDKWYDYQQAQSLITTFMTAVHFENLREEAARKMAARGDAYK